jgi:hypothetical protein
VRRVLVFCGSALAVAGAILACGVSRLPQPEYVSQTTSALERVPYPPPPARVEYVPEQPRAGAVWIDGEWSWQGRRWAWKAGRWVVPPEGAAYAPWIAVRDRSGVLYVASGVWRGADGGEIEAPAPLAEGRPRGGSVVNPEGETVEPGQVLHGREPRDAQTSVPIVEAGANPPKDVEAPEPEEGGAGAGGAAPSEDGEGASEGGS